jgi:predicted membrane protein
MLIERIKGQLTKDIIQRVMYVLGLTLWTFLMWDGITEFPYATSSLGFNYITLFMIAALILFLQIIRNNKLLWGLIFGLVTAYIVISLYLVIADAIERSGNHVKAIDWEIKDILILLLLFGVLFIIDWTIYRIKPKRLI